MDFTFSTPNPGDVIRVKLNNGLYHFGIYVSDDEVIQFGLPPVDIRRASGDITVLATDVTVFCAGCFAETGKLSRTEKKRAKKPDDIIASARARIGEGGYNFFHNNCEHFVNECVFGVKKSEQVDKMRQSYRRNKTYVYIEKLPSSPPKGRIYPESRKRYVEECANESVRIQRAAVWKLLEKGLKHSLSIDLRKTDIKREPSGKWTLTGCYISLSHTSGYAAVAISSFPVGVDIEEIVNKDYEKQFSRILCPEESGLVMNEPQDFLKLWTAKESIFKQSGEGGFIPSRINTLEKRVQTSVINQFNLIASVSASGDVEYFVADGKNITGLKI